MDSLVSVPAIVPRGKPFVIWKRKSSCYLSFGPIWVGRYDMEFLSSKGQKEGVSECIKVWNSSQKCSCQVHGLKLRERKKTDRKREESERQSPTPHPFCQCPPTPTPAPAPGSANPMQWIKLSVLILNGTDMSKQHAERWTVGLENQRKKVLTEQRASRREGVRSRKTHTG